MVVPAIRKPEPGEARCATCPENVVQINKVFILEIPSHHCRLMFDPMQPKGKPILNPNTVPGWCPLAND